MQTNRQVEVISPLGEDVLLFHSMTAREELGRPFQFDINLLSSQSDIDYKEILGQNVSVRLNIFDGRRRYFNGFVSHFAQGGMFGNLFAYHATVRPWVWLLTRTSDCRIFREGMDVPEIIQSEILRKRGFTAFESPLRGSYRPWEYCVQYRESDFNFMSRLMEQEGIYYYFKHEEHNHTLVFCDSISAHDPYPGYVELPYYPPGNKGQRERDHIYGWGISQGMESGAVSKYAFDFTNTQANLDVYRENPEPHPYADMEVFDSNQFGYPIVDEGENYNQIDLERLKAWDGMITGRANARGISAGSLFTLTKHPIKEYNKEYLIVSAAHHLRLNAYSSGAEIGGPAYSCTFKVLDSSQPFRSLRTTGKPMVQGPQTAIVVGPKGQEIYTDKYGRVRVQFHWDRYGKRDQDSSCWIRVSQAWAGPGLGDLRILRIGQEVVVEFLEGDPGHPIITGCVYNNRNMPPFTLPANATKMGTVTRSSKGGSPKQFNEISMDDKMGNEEVKIHAQKDMKVGIENDNLITVGKNRMVSVGEYMEIVCGKSKITMDKEGNVTIMGTQFNFEADTHIQITSPDTDID